MAWDTATVDNVKESIDSVLTELSIDDVKSEGMTVRIGGRVVKLEITEETTLPEDDIRAEYSEKLTRKLQTIKEKVNEKLSEMSYMVEQNRMDYEEKERELNDRLSSSNIMPNITYEEAKQGLSVVSDGNGKMVWLYQGVYWPKFVDGRPIDPKYSKRMISPVTIVIKTEDDRVNSVTVRKPIGLGKFSHYHGMSARSDCWGEWNIPSHWKEPSDILSIARESLVVLENVNSHSPGTSSPTGLPRLSTLQQHLVSPDSVQSDEYTPTRADERSGIVPETSVNTTAIWST